MNVDQYVRFLALALRSPRIFRAKMNAILARLRDIPNFPPLVAVSLFSGCNLACHMCGQWRTRSEQQPAAWLPANIWQGIIDEVGRNGSEMYVWGGEPMLHPEFPEILRMIRNSRVSCTINTNGTMLEWFAPHIVENAIDSLDVSLDGPPAIHDAVRGKPGLFNTIMSGISAICRVARKTGRPKPLIKAVATISEQNVNALDSMVECLESVQGVDMTIIQLGWFIPTKAGISHEERVARDFGVTALRWRGFCSDEAARLACPTQALFGRISRLSHLRKPILFFPALGLKELPVYYQDFYARFSSSQCCPALSRELHVLADGRVSVCLDWPDIVLGKLPNLTIQEIWHGQPLRDWRENIRQKGLFPACFRCCALFR